MKLLKNKIAILFFCFSCSVISQETLSSEAAYNKYQALQLQIKNNNLKFSDETYWAYYFEINDLVKQIKNNNELVLLHYYKCAYNFRYLGLPKEAIKHYKAFFKYYETNTQFFSEAELSNFRHYRAQSYGYLADSYAKAAYLDSANMVHKKNIEFTKADKNLNRASALNNYGLFFYWNKKELDSSLIYFKKSFQLTKALKPVNHLLGSVRDNIADVYVEQGKIAEANVLYKENFEFYKTSRIKPANAFSESRIDFKRFAAAGFQLIDTAIILEDFKSVDTVLQQMHKLLYNPEKKANASSRLYYLQGKELVLLAKNQPNEAYLWSKKVKQLSDSIVTIENNKKSTIKNAISDVAFQRLKARHIFEKQEKESKIKNQRLKLWIISISSISIFSFLAFLYFSRKQHLINAKNKQKIAELQNEKLNSQIESKQRDLSDFAINLTQNQEWAKALATKLEHLKTTKGRERKKLFDAFEQDIQNKITFDVDTKDFYQRLDTLNDAFYSKLQNKFPDLSKTEKRLCSLIRLKIESYEIAALQNITLASLNTSRYRLRKKLNLDKDEDLNDFIQSL